jgi:hypothetical protein
MSNDLPEVKELLLLLAEIINEYEGTLSGRTIANALYGHYYVKFYY